MSAIEQSVDVNVAVKDAYRQWSHLRGFPRFMQGVERIEQISDTRSRWTTNIGGVRREFVAELTEDEPDERVAWRSVSGPAMTGAVMFDELGPRQTRVEVDLDFTPHGLVETVADRLGIISHRIRNDLERFKDFTERHGPHTRVRAVEPTHHEQRRQPGMAQPQTRERPGSRGMTGRPDLGGPPMGRPPGPDTSPLEPQRSQRSRSAREEPAGSTASTRESRSPVQATAEAGRTGLTPHGDGTGRQPGPAHRMGEPRMDARRQMDAQRDTGARHDTSSRREPGARHEPGARRDTGARHDTSAREAGRRRGMGADGSPMNRPTPEEQAGEPTRDRAGERPPSGEESR